MILLWLLSSLLLYYSFTFPIELPITKSEKNTYDIKVCLGTPKQCFELGVKTHETSIILFSNSPFKADYSSTYKTVSVDSDIINGVDTIQLNSDTILSDAYFIRTNLFGSNKNGIFGIGFPRNENDPYNMLLRLLANAPKKIFYFDPIKQVLGYGDYPTQYPNQSNRVLKKKCQLIVNSDKLNDTQYYCTLNSIMFKTEIGSVFYPIHSKVSISFGFNGIQVPMYFYNLIKEEYLIRYLKQYDCVENDDDEEYRSILCRQNLNDSALENITVVIGNWSYRLTSQDLFCRYRDDKVFLIMAKINKSDWIFGYPFLKNYISVVDLEAMDISFIKP